MMNSNQTLLLLAAILTTAIFVGASDPATKCSGTACVSPCLCSGTTTPYGWLPTDVPQMILVVYQGSVTSSTYTTYYQNVLNGLLNPNGCQVGATYFLSHKYTDYTTVNAIYGANNDLGVQSITGASFQNKDEATIYNEIAGERLYIESLANLPSGSVRGVQPPSLCPAGNNQYDAISQAGFDYDQSLASRATSAPYWPYSLDYLTGQDIMSCTGPTDSYPGVYEFPLNDYISDNGALCNSLGSCLYGTNVTSGYELLTTNFARYKAQATPFLINVDLTWLETNTSNPLDLNRFLSEQLATGTTYVVTMNQAADWFETPTKLADIASLASWSCPERPVSCPPMRCDYNSSTTLYLCSGNFTQCPSDYPWVDNLPWLQKNPADNDFQPIKLF